MVEEATALATEWQLKDREGERDPTRVQTAQALEVILTLAMDKLHSLVGADALSAFLTSLQDEVGRGYIEGWSVPIALSAHLNRESNGR